MPPPPPTAEETPWDTLWEDTKRWLSTAHVTTLVSVFVFSYGTFLAVGEEPESTFFCSSLLDSKLLTLALQFLGLFLDAAIAVLLWRILCWTKTTKLRLKTLGVIQVLSGVFIKVFQMLASPFIAAGEGYPPSFWGIRSLYLFDILIDSFAFTILISSLSILVCETSPVMPASVITFVAGLSASVQNIRRIGSWQMVSKTAAIVPLHLVCFAYCLYLYTSNTRTILFIRRSFMVIILILILTGMTLFGLLKSDTIKYHPLERTIYDTRIDADRWLRRASISDSLRIAVDVYQERHYGRDPPPNFDKWYDFAKARKSVIIDHFEQMESDILPFWGMKPEAIRQAYNERVPKEPHIAVVTVENKRASHNHEADDENKKVLDELVKMINGFVEHLSDMKIPINLSDQPRVLTPWSELTRYTKAGRAKKFKLLSSRAEEAAGEAAGEAAPQAPKADEPVKGQSPEKQPDRDEQNAAPKAAGLPLVTPRTSAADYASIKAFRELEASACPAGTPGRSGLHWNVRDFCSECVHWHTDGQFIWSWSQSKSMCDQQDLTRLHSFHMSAPKIAPIQELLPVFGKFKADGFNDILIPLIRPADETLDISKHFRQRKDELYWRGKIGDRPISDEALRGSHKHRLLHLVNNATAADRVTMVLTAPAQTNWFAYESVRAREANDLLPFNVGISDYTCKGRAGCEETRAELGLDNGPVEEPLERRYVLLMDEDSAPPAELLRTIRSPGSVPFMASVFGEWYSERLIPWLHFVPVDLRFHALHSTLAYFVGLKDRGKVNGREVDTDSRWEDGEWIATQGNRWAEKALRREDMEIYLFRLLLEWGRVVRDDRDSIGFRLEKS